MPQYSSSSWSLAPGTPVYAQVDSDNPATNYGFVLERHEKENQPYNNILGPVLSTGAAGPPGQPAASGAPVPPVPSAPRAPPPDG
jgi:hypothetical protein